MCTFVRWEPVSNSVTRMYGNMLQCHWIMIIPHYTQIMQELKNKVETDTPRNLVKRSEIRSTIFPYRQNMNQPVKIPAIQVRTLWLGSVEAAYKTGPRGIA